MLGQLSNVANRWVIAWVLLAALVSHILPSSMLWMGSGVEVLETVALPAVPAVLFYCLAQSVRFLADVVVGIEGLNKITFLIVSTELSVPCTAIIGEHRS